MLYEAESGDIQMALTGESLICRKLSVYREERFLKLRDMLRNADVTFGNAECLFQDYSDPPNTYAGGGATGGTYMAAPPESVAELKWMGIDIVSTANNHASDFSDSGVLTNLKFLDQYGMAHAGTGNNLTEACAPAYFDTPKGRIALLASADWGPRGTGAQPWPFPMGVMAGEQSPYSRGRPGCNLIRHHTKFTVNQEVFNAIQVMRKELGFDRVIGGGGRPSIGVDTEAEFTFMDSRIALGSDFSMSTLPEQEDLELNYRWVRDARRNADWVLYSFHNHGATRSPELPSDHTRVVARGVIDNGADMFIGHGPHRDRGIEIYKGKPIFYSLGDFICQNGQVLWVPYDVMKRTGLGYENTPADFHDARVAAGGIGSATGLGWESVVVTLTYAKRQLKDIRLYPIDLGIGLPRSYNGRPVLAAAGNELNRRVLERFQEMSKPYGTEIQIDNGVGIIHIS